MRPIDADALKELFPDNGEGSWTYNATAKAYIDAQPTIQPDIIYCKDSAIFNIKKLPSAQPERKTGRWIDITTDESIDVEYKCSECGFEMFSWCGLTNFCPNCGADMRGEIR